MERTNFGSVSSNLPMQGPSNPSAEGLIKAYFRILFYRLGDLIPYWLWYRQTLQIHNTFDLQLIHSVLAVIQSSIQRRSTGISDSGDVICGMCPSPCMISRDVHPPKLRLKYSATSTGTAKSFWFWSIWQGTVTCMIVWKYQRLYVNNHRGFKFMRNERPILQDIQLRSQFPRRIHKISWIVVDTVQTSYVTSWLHQYLLLTDWYSMTTM